MIVAAAAALAVALIVREEEAPPPVPPPCGVGAEPECRVPPPPCEAAAARDRNRADRAVAPRDGLGLRPSAMAPLPYGFNDAAVATGQLTTPQDVALHEIAGSTLNRFVLDWGAVEATPNEFDFTTTDELYCEAAAAGVRPLFTLTGIPPWALDEGAAECDQAPCVQPPAERHLPALRRFAELAAIRYPEAAAIEAWNEPNFTAFWPQPDPARYARLLREVYLGVKDGDPEMTVLGGSVTNTPEDDPATGTLSMSNFLTGMFAAGAAEHMDGLSMHAYPFGELGGTDDLLTPQVAEARRIGDAAAGSRTLPLWITETGIPTEEGGFAPAMTEDEQAEQLVQIYELASSGATDAVLFHTLVDPPPEVPGGPGFGWFTQPADGAVRAKPVVCAFRGLSGLEGCPESVPLG